MADNPNRDEKMKWQIDRKRKHNKRWPRNDNENEMTKTNVSPKRLERSNIRQLIK